MEEPIAKKAYYSIGDVCELTGLKPHVLRYWETQFPPLRPTKNRAGNRAYRPKEIELILLLRNLLYEQKFTIEGARRRLKEMKQKDALPKKRVEVRNSEVVDGIKVDLAMLMDRLTLPTADH